MAHEVARASIVDATVPVHACHPATMTRYDDVYTLMKDGRPRWQVTIGWGPDGPGPFREQLVWEPAGVVAIGGGASVYLIGLADGVLRTRFEVPDGFGHFGLDETKHTLYVLGWRHLLALTPDLSLRWCARDLAVDGLAFYSATTDRVEVGAEMDPPGGWDHLVLDAATGHTISRNPPVRPQIPFTPAPMPPDPDPPDIPASWYTNPHGPGRRYWDQGWTDHTDPD